MHFKGHLILSQKAESLNPIRISEKVVMLRLRELWVICVEVQHVADPSHPLGEGMTFEDIVHIIHRQITFTNNCWSEQEKLVYHY